MYEILKQLFLVVSVAIASICGYLLCLDRLGDPVFSVTTSQLMAATIFLPMLASAWKSDINDTRDSKLLTTIGTTAFISLIGCWIYASGGSISVFLSEISIAVNLFFSIIVCLLLILATSLGMLLGIFLKRLMRLRPTI